jgi:hypothetical protein
MRHTCDRDHLITVHTSFLLSLVLPLLKPTAQAWTPKMAGDGLMLTLSVPMAAQVTS